MTQSVKILNYMYAISKYKIFDKAHAPNYSNCGTLKLDVSLN